MNDHHSYVRNIAAAKRKPEKIQFRKGFEPMTSGIPVQCSTNRPFPGCVNLIMKARLNAKLFI